MILSCDPSINKFGIALYSIEDNQYIVHKTKLIDNMRKFTDEEKELIKKYGDRLPKLLKIKKDLTDIIEECNLNDPITNIIVEAPFYSSLRPQTFGSLVEILTMIKLEIAFTRNLDYNLLEPLYVKKYFSNISLASKDMMLLALKEKLNNGEIISKLDNLDISEHEVDAIAIGYTYWLKSKQES